MPVGIFLQLHQLIGDGKLDEAHQCLAARFVHDVLPVGFYCSGTYEKRFGNIGGGILLTYELQDLHLSLGE